MYRRDVTACGHVCPVIVPEDPPVPRHSAAAHRPWTRQNLIANGWLPGCIRRRDESLLYTLRSPHAISGFWTTLSVAVDARFVPGPPGPREVTLADGRSRCRRTDRSLSCRNTPNRSRYRCNVIISSPGSVCSLDSGRTESEEGQFDRDATMANYSLRTR